jgi:hypothetical protein
MTKCSMCEKSIDISKKKHTCEMVGRKLVFFCNATCWENFYDVNKTENSKRIARPSK